MKREKKHRIVCLTLQLIYFWGKSAIQNLYTVEQVLLFKGLLSDNFFNSVFSDYEKRLYYGGVFYVEYMEAFLAWVCNWIYDTSSPGCDAEFLFFACFCKLSC